MASRRARREQAEESPLLDVWFMTALAAAVLLSVGGWLQAQILGALAGAAVGIAVGALAVSQTPTLRAALTETWQLRFARRRRRHDR